MSFNHILYYDNGQIKVEMNLVDDYPVGVVKKYWPDGTLMNESHYEGGKLHGDYKEYDQNGTLKKSKVFVEGKDHEIDLLLSEVVSPETLAFNE